MPDDTTDPLDALTDQASAAIERLEALKLAAGEAFARMRKESPLETEEHHAAFALWRAAAYSAQRLRNAQLQVGEDFPELLTPGTGLAQPAK